MVCGPSLWNRKSLSDLRRELSRARTSGSDPRANADNRYRGSRLGPTSDAVNKYDESGKATIELAHNGAHHQPSFSVIGSSGTRLPRRARSGFALVLESYGR